MKIEIPEGYEAKIEGNKVVLEPKESEDERIRRAIGAAICGAAAEIVLEANGVRLTDALTYLEKQKDEAQKQFNLGIQAGKEEVLYEMEKEQKSAEMDNEEIELSDFESELFSVFSDGWQQYLHGEEVDVAQWAKEHSAQLLNAAKQELKPVEWSEEDELFRDNIITYLNLRKDKNLPEDTKYPVLDAWIDWLKFLRPQPKYEWSEEDERNLYNIIEAIKYTFDVSEGSGGSRLITWLKFRLRPQPHWKPSKEQMAVLYDAISNLKHDNYKNIHVLESLYNVLQKLL